MTTERKLLGRVPREAIHLFELPRLPAAVVDGFRGLAGPTGSVSDALDELGLPGAIPASVLAPLTPGAKIVGPALTVRNVAHELQPHRAAREKLNGQGEGEAHNLAQPGDVLVIEGLPGVSNLGGLSATIGRRQGEIGAIVDGGVRDPDEARAAGLAVWARGVTPISGKWRLRTVAINGTVHVAGVRVEPGDLAVADEAGVCFIPFKHAEAVLAEVRKIDDGDARRRADVNAGVGMLELFTKKYK
ncbi:MAG TPA: RraA family protein [Burkholderiales bacterium]|nr:RraA family protein [Burkholderiales bacterium]